MWACHILDRLKACPTTFACGALGSAVTLCDDKSEHVLRLCRDQFNRQPEAFVLSAHLVGRRPDGTINRQQGMVILSRGECLSMNHRIFEGEICQNRLKSPPFLCERPYNLSVMRRVSWNCNYSHNMEISLPIHPSSPMIHAQNSGRRNTRWGRLNPHPPV